MSEVTEIRQHEQVLLIAVLKRSLDDDSSRKMADDVLTAVAARPNVPIVLDLSKVQFAPSVTLGSLVQLSKSLKLDGHRIALIGVNKRTLEAIRVTRLHTVLEMHDTLEQVIDASTRRT